MVHQGSNLPCIEAAPMTTYARRILRLAFLAPTLQAAILEGRQPPGLTMRTILAAAPALRCCQANAKGLRLGCGRGETHSRSGYA
jgi:hypothetical protein